MTHEPIGEGGTANSPPFPRPAQHDPHRATDFDATAGPSQGDREMTGEAPDRPFGTSGQAFAGGSEPNARADESEEESSAGGVTGRAGAEILRRLERTVRHGLCQLADQLEHAARRIDHLADERLHALGPSGERAAGAAESTAGWLHGSADYLRGSELRDLQRDLERQVREKPLQSLLVSAGAGWLLGKIVR